MTGTYVLADGREFPSNSPLCRWERQMLKDDVQRLLDLDTREERAALLAKITRSCGEAYGEKLKQHYTEAHTKRAAPEAGRA